MDLKYYKSKYSINNYMYIIHVCQTATYVHVTSCISMYTCYCTVNVPVYQYVVVHTCTSILCVHVLVHVLVNDPV